MPTKQPLVDFIISNPGHHAAMMQPVMARLTERGCHCRLLSLCEFRGLNSPTALFDRPGVEFIRLVPFNFRSPNSGGRQTGTPGQRWSRRLARRASWELLLKRPLKRHFKHKPDIVVLPNDAAFPYDLIVGILNTAAIPYLLLQEGIRFPLPGSEEGDAYGLGGAAAIAAWGEGSAAYFLGRGVPPATIHATGSPRFDTLPEMDFTAEAKQLKERHNLQDNTLLFMSNPIDDQGFCTTPDKMALVGRFLDGIQPLFDAPDFRLIIKLHPRESVSDFQALAADWLAQGGHSDSRITVMGSGPLYPLFTLSKAAIVLASTVGLEALMMDVPLGVLEIPGTGFVYDYVEQGAAVGLSWQRPIAEQVCELLTGNICDKQAVQDYIKYSLSTIGEASDRVTELIQQVLAEKQHERV